MVKTSGGLNYVHPGSKKRGSYPSENSLRKEHKMLERVAYEIITGTRNIKK